MKIVQEENNNELNKFKGPVLVTDKIHVSSTMIKCYENQILSVSKFINRNINHV